MAKTAPRDLEAVIFSKKSAGVGQKTIARDLGISEWQVRTILRKSDTHRIHSKVHDEIRLRSVKKGKSGVKIAIVLSDIHIPYHDQRALAIALAYTKDRNPDRIVLNGDIVDMANVSRFPRDPHEVFTLADELQETKDFLRLLRKQHPEAQIDYTMGNHEIRLSKYTYENSPGLSSLPELAIDKLLAMEEFGITFHDQSSKVNLGDLEIFHGDVVRSKSGESARSHMLKRGGSVLMGHVHRAAMVSRTDKHGVHFAIENPHLSVPDPDYMNDPDWVQGFTEISYLDSGPFNARLHVIRNGLLVVDGAEYTAK